MDATPKASIIIVNYNGGEYLARCLECVAAQTEAGFECFVIDNGSTDGSLETLPAIDARFQIVRLGENTGFAAANNYGAALARAPYLAMLNPDAFARPNWLSALLAAAKEFPNAGMIGSLQYLALEEEPVFDGLGDCYHIAGIAYRAGFGRRGLPPPGGFVFGPCAAAALYNREQFLRLGGFDERFFCYHEDVDLAFRFQLAGYDCYQSPDAIVDHVSSGIAGRASAFAVYHGTRNRIWTFIKNMPLPLFIVLLPVHLAANAAFLAWSAFRPGRFRPTARGMWHGWRGVRDAWKQRAAVQKLRTARAADILRKMTISPLKVITRGIHIRLPK